jgi:1,4-dihydroxy-2-naphthoate octaprenyltransferase
MDPRSIVSFARIKPLAAWSLSAGMLGTALAFYQSGGGALDLVPLSLAIICVVLMQYVAHPMNDIMDLDLDRQAPIASTGRVKPLVDGSITVVETKWLSSIIIVAILLLIAILVAFRPILVLPAAYGMAALIGYNHPSLRWAYRPFTELYLSVPINIISVSVIAYLGSGQMTAVAAIVSVAFGFVSSAFFVTMMSMDFQTDRANGKRTTVVAFPRVRWCTAFPLIGLCAVIIGTPILVMAMGTWQGLLVAGLSGAVLMALSIMGSRADNERLAVLDKGEGANDLSGRCRLQQLYLSVAFAVSLSLILASLEVR